MDFKIVIPARFASTRLPGKPLLAIAGKPMIHHVFERARQSGAGEIVVATDDQRIADVAASFDAKVCMTASTHSSGTERIAEVVRRFDWSADTIVVNLQGDEPGMPASLILQVAQDMDNHPDAQVTTLSAPITDRDKLFDPHVVKVVTNMDGYALYFSRAPIPYHRDEFLHPERPLPDDVGFARHIGLYAYRAGFLDKYVNWPPTSLERAESLEQLRVLAHGDLIHVSEAHEEPGHGVDTMDDLQRVEEEFRR